MNTHGRVKWWARVAGFAFGCLVVSWLLAKLWVHDMKVKVGGLKIAVTIVDDQVGRAVVDTRLNQLVWNRFAGGAGLTDVFFPTGRVVFGLVEKSNRPPLFFVHFRDLENATNILAGTHYYARGPFAHFLWRDVRDATGKVARRDVWYKEMWRELLVSNGRTGIVLEGKWYPIVFDTNGVASILGANGEGKDSGSLDESLDFR